MKFRVTVFPASDIPEQPIFIEEVERISFVDNDSHGPMHNFGINTSIEVGQKIAFVSSPNVMAVSVERTS